MKDEIRLLRDKADEITVFYEQKVGGYLALGEELFNMNRENVEESIALAGTANRYRHKFAWYLLDSPLIKELDIDIEKEAADFKAQFVDFFK
ncbi:MULTISPECIES: hypothetical protein [unclassified Neisseria]|uniref:hypothetical protein n=1 Tax=unclassified Neisseria TaxID=2623750 RepID=UPI002666C464|nr:MULTISPECIES: hypothetical protein [unclassified Neisseria]MDO1509495.1 hypothetical protein [Neisseria sp. MVDL19-042950]MDO1515733.1 hypothetical protein [Neisseria sp. MVDL18-041461]MDO1563443.1 hypothetical protein [Neisseria sp. MVDL20-010259]